MQEQILMQSVRLGKLNFTAKLKRTHKNQMEKDKHKALRQNIFEQFVKREQQIKEKQNEA